MMTQSKQMRIFPDLSKDFVGKKMKQFIFWTVLVLHCSVFILPLCWYLLSEWLNPPQKVISVTLVENPSLEPFSKKGLPKSGKENPAAKNQDVAAPNIPNIDNIPDDIPDIPDVPDVPNIKPRPKPAKTKVAEKTKPVPSKTASASHAKTPKTSVPKKTMEEQIREWRKQHGKTVKVSKNTNPAGGTGSSTSSKELESLIKDLKGTGGSGGSGESGSGGVYNRYAVQLRSWIQREWQPVAPDRKFFAGTKPEILLYFQIDSSGRILRKYIKQRCGIAVVDAAAESMLNNLRVLPAPPPGQPLSFILNLEVDPRIEY